MLRAKGKWTSQLNCFVPKVLIVDKDDNIMEFMVAWKVYTISQE